VTNGPLAGAPDDLLEAFGSRGLTSERAADVFAAMAWAVSHARSGTPDGRDAAAVVLVEPEGFPEGRVIDLLAALDRYAPHVVRWRYDESATPRLRGFTEVVREKAPPPPPAPPSSRSAPAANGNAPPRLRLTGVDPDAPAPPASSRAIENPGATPDLLSEDEIDMLLGDGPEHP